MPEFDEKVKLDRDLTEWEKIYVKQILSATHRIERCARGLLDGEVYDTDLNDVASAFKCLQSNSDLVAMSVDGLKKV